MSGVYTDECSAGIDGAGTYSCILTNLTLNTTYFVRARAVNSGGTAYGNMTSFTTTSEALVGPRQIKFRGDVKMRGDVRMK